MDEKPVFLPRLPSAQPAAGRGSPKSKPGWLVVGLMFLYVVVLVGSLFLAYSSQHSKLETAQKQLAAARSTASADESKSVDTSKYQAVFLSSGQVYFGKITFINNQYMKLTDIFYLQTGTGSDNIQAGQSSSSTPVGSASLVKLGCEVHAPEDQMIINNSRVDFWENLQNDGKVVQAINSFSINHPNGQSCP